MSLLANQIKNFLGEKGTIPLDTIRQFSEDCYKSIYEKFADRERKDRTFRLTMSNVGRPLCQLQMEKSGALAEPLPYNMTLVMTYGDMVEALVIAILKGAGANVQSQQENVELEIEGEILRGRYDVEIDDCIYDIKSTSNYSFTTKMSGGFMKLAQEDYLGYITQGYAYSEAAQKPFGGLILVDKSTGEIEIMEPPSYDAQYREDALAKIATHVRAIKEDAPFKRQFTDVEEVFNKKKTGNKILVAPCNMCAYKQTCWPGVKYMPAPVSTAKEPPWKWYTEVKNA